MQKSILYLDADLLIELDILILANFNMQDFTIGAVPGAKIENALEKDFFIQDRKLSPGDAYFNSCVLLINLDKWRKDSIRDDV